MNLESACQGLETVKSLTLLLMLDTVTNKLQIYADDKVHAGLGDEPLYEAEVNFCSSHAFLHTLLGSKAKKGGPFKQLMENHKWMLDRDNSDIEVDMLMVTVDGGVFNHYYDLMFEVPKDGCRTKVYRIVLNKEPENYFDMSWPQLEKLACKYAQKIAKCKKNISDVRLSMYLEELRRINQVLGREENV